MGIINGNLKHDLSNFHQPGQAELAVVVIDQFWMEVNPDKSLTKEMQAQCDIIKFIKEEKKLNCRVIVIEKGKKTSPHLMNVIGNPDLLLNKKEVGVLGDQAGKRLLEYLDQYMITTLLVMGYHREACVEWSIMGKGLVDQDAKPSCYPGFLSYGYTILTSPELITPYCPEMYSIVPKFSPDCVSYQEQTPYSYKINAVMKKVNKEAIYWPPFTLHAGVRIYTEI